MLYLKALIAIAHGFRFCLGDAAIRRLAMIPWAVGALCYLGSVVVAWHAFSPLLGLFVDEPSGFWGTILYGLAWLLTAVLLLVATLVVSVVLVMLFTAAFQTAIASRVLAACRLPVPAEQSGIGGLVKETNRTILVESAKLLWLLPLMMLAFILGLIPLLTPAAIVAAAWLLAFQFVDVVLDVYRTTARERLAFSFRNGLLLIVFGLTLALLWAIPLMGLLLPPVAAAAAAWLLAESGLLAEHTARLQRGGGAAIEDGEPRRAKSAPD